MEYTEQQQKEITEMMRSVLDVSLELGTVATEYLVEQEKSLRKLLEATTKYHEVLLKCTDNPIFKNWKNNSEKK